MNTTIVPDQVEGKKNDLFEEVICGTQDEARERYRLARGRLLRPDTWQELAGALSAEFRLFDTSAEPLQSHAEQGDYIRIDLPGPGPQAGDGYDWVVIGEIAEDTDAGSDACIGMRVSPVPPPFASDEPVAHFFTERASSTFVVQLKARTVRAEYHGRNEVINNETEKAVDNIRNTLTGGAAKAGVSEMQWTALLKGLLSD